MAEVLVEFDTVLTAADGTRWVPRVCGRQEASGLWDGWVEFLAMDDTSEAARTGRETVQPNRDDLMYWAQGLSEIYLDGALKRAHGERVVLQESAAATRPHFDSPAPHISRAPHAHDASGAPHAPSAGFRKHLPASSHPERSGDGYGDGAPPRPVLNPFEVYQQGLDILVQELSALSPRRLRDIAVGYGFADAHGLKGAGREALASIIVEGVRHPPMIHRSNAEADLRES